MNFGYGYIVQGSDGISNRAVALTGSDRISLTVRVAGKLEKYQGLAGDLWAWCYNRGLEYPLVLLEGHLND